jgi:hypothetical protein
MSLIVQQSLDEIQKISNYTLKLEEKLELMPLS